MIRPCSVAELFDDPDFAAILAEYADELKVDGLPALCASRDLYQRLESVGSFFCIASYCDGRLSGFITLHVTTFPHYGRVGAVTESYFVSKSMRKHGAGIGLLNAARRLAKSMDAFCLMVSAPTGGKLEQVMKSSKHRQSNSVFMVKL